MNIINSLKNVAVEFTREEEGSQVVEYALVIALVSTGLAVLLEKAFSTGAGFDALVNRVKACFATNATTC